MRNTTLKNKKLMKTFKLSMSVAKFLRKAYFHNNLKFEKVKYNIINDYRNKRIILQFVRLK